MSFFKKIALDTRISIKIGAASVVSILLLGAIVVSQFLGDAAVRAAKDSVDREQGDRPPTSSMPRRLSAACRWGIRDIRLAATPDDLKRAMEFLEARSNSATRFVEQGRFFPWPGPRAGKGDNLGGALEGAGSRFIWRGVGKLRFRNNSHRSRSRFRPEAREW